MDLDEILEVINVEVDKRIDVIQGKSWTPSIQSARTNESIATAEVIAAGIRELYR